MVLCFKNRSSKVFVQTGSVLGRPTKCTFHYLLKRLCFLYPFQQWSSTVVLFYYCVCGASCKWENSWKQTCMLNKRNCLNLMLKIIHSDWRHSNSTSWIQPMNLPSSAKCCYRISLCNIPSLTEEHSENEQSSHLWISTCYIKLLLLMLFMFGCMYSFNFLGMQSDKHHCHSVRKC